MFPVNVCGTIYPYPEVNENPWGIEHIQWAVAVSNCVTANANAIDSIIGSGVFINPMTNEGDIIYQNSGLPARLGVGFDGQVLTLDSGVPTWGNLPSPSPLYVFSDSSESVQISSPSYVDVANLVLSVTTTGNPVEIKLQDDNSGFSTINITSINAVAGDVQSISDLRITRDGTPVAVIPIRNWLNTQASPPRFVQYIPPSSISFIDDVPAGTYEYKIQAKTGIPDITIDVFFVKMVLKTYV